MKPEEIKKSFTIHDLPAAERPRERLQKYCSESLSAQEIIAILLGRGISGESVMLTAQRLPQKFEGLKGITAASVIFAHNHPSGDTAPSEDDIKLTRRLTQPGEIIGVEVLDHIIIGRDKFLSLKREGMF